MCPTKSTISIANLILFFVKGKEEEDNPKMGIYLPQKQNKGRSMIKQRCMYCQHPTRDLCGPSGHMIKKHPEKDWVRELQRILGHPNINEDDKLKDDLKDIRNKIRKRGNKIWNEISFKRGYGMWRVERTSFKPDMKPCDFAECDFCEGFVLYFL